MPANSRIRATLAQAEALSVGHPNVVAVVILVVAPGSILLVAEPADRAMLPTGLRAAIEAALRGEG